MQFYLLDRVSGLAWVAKVVTAYPAQASACAGRHHGAGAGGWRPPLLVGQGRSQWMPAALPPFVFEAGKAVLAGVASGLSSGRAYCSCAAVVVPACPASPACPACPAVHCGAGLSRLEPARSCEGWGSLEVAAGCLLCLVVGYLVGRLGRGSGESASRGGASPAGHFALASGRDPRYPAGKGSFGLGLGQ